MVNETNRVKPVFTPITVTLSDGRVATNTRRLKAKDKVHAQRLIGKKTDELEMALVSCVVTIDGKPVIYEDLLEMDLDDYLLLLGLANGKDVTSLLDDSNEAKNEGN